MLIEKLENRQLLSTTVAFNEGVLLVRTDNSGGNVLVTETAAAAPGAQNTAVVTDLSGAPIAGPFSGVRLIVVLGGCGDDQLAVLTQEVPVFVDGGAGNDLIGVAANAVDATTGLPNAAFNGSGSIILGGSGNDNIQVVGLSNSAVLGGSGDDTITVQGEQFIDGSGAQVIVGANMYVSGGNGNDNITTVALVDSLITGDNGNDSITNTLGANDTLLGGNGDDQISDAANTAKNFINGGNGNDIIIASATDCVQPSNGHDVVTTV